MKCPRCQSTHVEVKKKIEAIAGASASLYGMRLGTQYGLAAGPFGALVGGAIGAVLGGTVGAAVGSAVDEKVSTVICHNCGCEFYQ